MRERVGGRERERVRQETEKERERERERERAGEGGRERERERENTGQFWENQTQEGYTSFWVPQPSQRKQDIKPDTNHWYFSFSSTARLLLYHNFPCGALSRSSHTSHFTIGTLVATLPDAWPCWVSDRTGWPAVKVL